MDLPEPLRIERTFSAPIDKVFQAWTDPEILASWWGPNGVTNPVCNIDVRPGGLIEIVMLAGDELGELKGQRWPMTGEYVEISEPTKLVYKSSAVINDVPILDCLNTITFEQIGEQTKMTLEVKVTRATEAAKMPLMGMSQGWSQSIDKLAKLFN